MTKPRDSTVDLDDDDAEIVVADSDEYNQTRRMKAIHQARDDVREAHRELTYVSEEPHEHYESRQRLAAAVAYYGSELAPLMEEAGWSHEFPSDFPWETLEDFVNMSGELPDTLRRARIEHDAYGDAPVVEERESMEAFRALNRFAREAGLGLDASDRDKEVWGPDDAEETI